MTKLQNEKIWDLIIKRIEEEKCILIIGPDIVLNDSEKSLNQQLKEYLENNASIRRYYAEDEFFSFSDDVQKEYALMDIQTFYGQLKPNLIHERIAEIPFHLTISLSPDLVLKQYLESKKQSFSFDFYNKEQNPQKLDKPTKEKPLIYNLFGSIDSEGSIILTYNDLFDYLVSIFSKFELPVELKSQLQSAKLILFLGFHFDKWYFKLLLRLLNLHIGKIVHAGLKDKKLLPQIINFYSEEFNVNFLNYSGLEIIENIYQRFTKGQLHANNTKKFDKQPEIFISYAWEPISEMIVGKLYKTLKSNGFNIILDKIDLHYKGNIKKFMETIGLGKYIIVVLSNKYLQSEYCMNEIMEIKKNGNIYERIFPIVTESADIYDELNRINYINYWDDKIIQLENKIKTVKNPSGTGQVIKKIDQFHDIRRIIDEITDMLRDMNSLTPEIHAYNNFEELLATIMTNMQTDINNHHESV